MRTFFMAVLAGVLTTGCAALFELKDPQAVASRVEVISDKYSGNTTIISPMVIVDGTTQGGIWLLTARLAGDAKPAQHDIYCLNIEFEAKDWRFFEAAYGLGGVKLEYRPSDRKVRTGGITEKGCIVLTRAYLDAQRARGLDLKVVGQRGSVTFAVPPQYLEGFLQVVDAHRSRR